MPKLKKLLGLTLFVAAVTVPDQARAQSEPILYPSRPLRQADVSLKPCSNASLRCLARAVADFNGDGKDDLLLEQAPLAAGQDRGASEVSGGLRTLSLILGPLVDDAGRPMAAAAHIDVDPPGHVAELAVVDFNGDGRQDMVFTGVVRGGSLERQRVAVVLGRDVWPAAIKVAAAARGDILIERMVRVSYNAPKLGQRLAATFADLNGDGHPDLVLASDPPAGVDGRGAPDSEVAVMLGGESWPWRSDFRADVTIAGLGRCEHGLGSVADVSGDGRPDLVLRQCLGNGLPDRPHVLLGRADWPATIRLPGAPDPDIVPPPGTPVPHPTRSAPPGRGYVLDLPGDQGLGPFDPGPMMVSEDLDGDGTRDLAFDLAGRTHVFAGGPDIADRLTAGHSTGIIVNASLGAVPLSRSWRPVKADEGPGATGEGPYGANTGLVLGQLQRPVNRRPAGRGAPVAGSLALTSVSLYRAGLTAVPLLDVAQPGDTTLYVEPGLTLWGMGDLNGDGAQDVLLGSGPTAGPVSYQVVLGPFGPGEVTIVNRR